MIYLLLSSIYATDVSCSETEQSFYGRFRSVVSSAQSYLPSLKNTMKIATAAGCTALYFMNEAAPSSQGSLLPTYNGTNTQTLVPYQGLDGNFNQMACLALTTLVSNFIGTLPSLLMGTSCLATGATAKRLVSNVEMLESDILAGNCTYYYWYLQQNSIANSILGTNGGNFSCPGPWPAGGGYVTWELSIPGINDTNAVDVAPALQQLNDATGFLSGGYGFSSESMVALATALQYFTGLTTLGLTRSPFFGSAGAEALAPALSNFLQLSRLSINGNNIGDSGITALAPALSFLSHLDLFDISSNNISASGARALAVVLPSMGPIGFFIMYNNPIGNLGALALVSGLRTHTELFQVQLMRNNISFTMCKYLKKVIHVKSGGSVSC